MLLLSFGGFLYMERLLLLWFAAINVYSIYIYSIIYMCVYMYI